MNYYLLIQVDRTPKNLEIVRGFIEAEDEKDATKKAQPIMKDWNPRAQYKLFQLCHSEAEARDLRYMMYPPTQG